MFECHGYKSGRWSTREGLSHQWVLLDLRVEAKLTSVMLSGTRKKHELQKTSLAIHEVGVLENTQKQSIGNTHYSFLCLEKKNTQTSARANEHGSQGFGLFFATLIHATEVCLFFTVLIYTLIKSVLKCAPYLMWTTAF